jgi:hypothetical protein
MDFGAKQSFSLYFAPTLTVYYPQGKSYHWEIRLYFESIGKKR